MSIESIVAEQQPDSFVFSAESEAEIKRHLAKYPEERKQSAVMPLLDIAQRQHDNWIPMKAIEEIADRLDMPKMRVLEVASFYTMYNRKRVGKCLFQVCGTTPCMLRGSDDVIRCIKDKLDISSGETSACGQFSMLEVECLGACVNAPIIQLNDDFYEDLDYQSTAALIDQLQAGEQPPQGSVINRQGSEASTGTTTLKTVKKDSKSAGK